MPKVKKCPTCKKGVPQDSKHLPFCCARCRDIDMGSWLQEGYRISRPLAPWELERTFYNPSSEPEPN